jgi:hypothetical protein
MEEKEIYCQYNMTEQYTSNFVSCQGNAVSSLHPSGLALPPAIATLIAILASQ